MLLLSTVRQYHGQTSLTGDMIVLTTTYLFFCVLLIIMCQFKPLIKEMLHRQQADTDKNPAAKILSKIGLSIADSIPLVVPPVTKPYFVDADTFDTERKVALKNKSLDKSLPNKKILLKMRLFDKDETLNWENL